MINLRVSSSIKKLSAFLLCLAFAAVFVIPLTASAKGLSKQKNVRVGWYESPFNSMDETGRRSGYAYEYQLKIAAYTG